MSIRRIGKVWYVDIYDSGKRFVRAVSESKTFAAQTEAEIRTKIRLKKLHIHIYQYQPELLCVIQIKFP